MKIAIAMLFIFGVAALIQVARDWRQLRRWVGTVEEMPVVRVGNLVPDVVSQPEPVQASGSVVIMVERRGKSKRGKRKDWRKQPKKRRSMPDDAA